MKINRLISVLLCVILFFSLASCAHGNNNHSNNNNSAGQNNTPSQNQGGEGKVTYVYSVYSKTIHLPECFHIGRINEEYLKTTQDLTTLPLDEYTICRDCLAPDVEEEEPEEDETNKIAKEDATFVINKKSKALHTLDCFRIKTMEEKNIQYTDLSLEALMELDENKPCKDCLPEAAKEYYEKHPELDTDSNSK